MFSLSLSPTTVEVESPIARRLDLSPKLNQSASFHQIAEISSPWCAVLPTATVYM
jgi:hypothetical protein